MAFTATDVKNLREMTGAGMMDCKRALTAADGDMDGAVKFLREKGLAAAAKKAPRIAADGMVVIAISDDRKAGAIVEVNSETDFVAKNEKFVTFANTIAKIVLDNDPADLDALKALLYPGSEFTVENMLHEMVLTIGENIQIRRFRRLESGVMESYIHMGGNIGVLAQFELDGVCPCNEDYKTASHDICMQIAAMLPRYVSAENVPAEVIAEEKEIQLVKAREENAASAKPKPDFVLEKIVMGRIDKFFAEICLLEQPFVKDDSITVGKMLAAAAAKAGGSIKLKEFVCYEKGEGIEKKKDDLAAEVASMVK